MKNLIAVFCAIAVAACSGDPTPPAAQIAFADAIAAARESVEQAEKTRNDAMIAEAEKKARGALKNPDVVADGWFATVDEVLQREDGIRVNSSYGSQEYHLDIVGPEMRAFALTLKQGDLIDFSGKLGREHSLTLSGGLSNPEFTLYPTHLRKRGAQAYLTQDFASSWEYRTEAALSAISKEADVVGATWALKKSAIALVGVKDTALKDDYAQHLCSVMETHGVSGGVVRLIDVSREGALFDIADVAARRGHKDLGSAQCAPSIADGSATVQWVDFTKPQK